MFDIDFASGGGGVGGPFFGVCFISDAQGYPLETHSPPRDSQREWWRQVSRGQRTSDAMVDAAGKRLEGGRGSWC